MTVGERRRHRGPLVITATPNVCWLDPGVPFPKTPAQRADEAKRCRDAGAAVLHMHAEDSWVASIDAVREATDMVVQCGMSSLPIEERMDVFRHGADMISVIVNHHDEAFAEVETHVLHPREELARYAELSDEFGVRPEFEIWHAGSIWNLEWLIGRRLVRAPYVTTLFLGWPGGTWSPPTVEEYLYRRRLLPAGSVVTVSVMAPEQLDVLATAIAIGDHVRVGTEDNPYSREAGGAASSTPRLVAEIADVAKALGRPIATPDQARDLLGIAQRVS